jgi:Sec-independent protein translocase protein TatA
MIMMMMIIIIIIIIIIIKTRLIPVIIGATGTISKSFRKLLSGNNCRSLLADVSNRLSARNIDYNIII